MAIILDGKTTAASLNDATKIQADKLTAQGIQPGIAVILVGEDPASQIYTRNKHRKAEKLGMKSVLIELPETVSQDEVINEVEKLNQDQSIHAILVQSPLPDHIDATTVTNSILPSKDVDGFNPTNLGKLYGRQPGNYPVACTPKGIMTLLKQYDITLAGKNVVVIGRSVLVGRPVAALMINQNATVTLAGRFTQNLKALAKTADILVVATGMPALISGQDIKPGATVIDVGINRGADGKLTGDVDFETASQVAGAITPVPGGVGPMTIATLMQQTVELTQWSLNNGK
ncbi:bifunctional 5,10-methylenetetrahydrofolate dehydrogenase/5,10-methenyltetrahydrofolate cyclohydrolase [Paucilactobacillus nenjiangensis]|uniref:bifunctional 5,10-methylenetetrahydrofolate dehydrogenase/5,10-methenyltetrahydrofolate cyclohydrolase n=1 Tax=Paucilactobacillus nenjiangensis TaxID=1296540 RepID=UPI0010F4EE9C|nr:tetrahydrofolate dehydrogenase/cyclohydrolase catalytic domain-containing protein [Paucilactobacillus nenjiangensis]